MILFRSTRARQRLAEFLSVESAGGIVMLIAAALALLAANSLLAAQYEAWLHFPVVLSAIAFDMPLAEAVKDVLMVAFFFVIGMELKRELVEGMLKDKRQVLLPLIAALGGMAVPALIFLFINKSYTAHTVGWAIPTATDIAFALAVLLLVAKRLPPALKIFLLAIAIFDDLGAILIIAMVYSSTIAALPLLCAALLCLMLAWLHHERVSAIGIYLALGTLLCVALAHAGIHTTIGGVITGMAMPLRGWKKEMPLERCLNLFHPWVSFGVLPLFAFTAAGMSLAGLRIESLLEPLTLGVIAGLFFGKQLGIFGASWLLIKMNIAALPEAVNWQQLYGVALLAGIGFTMSLFIGSLAFEDATLQEAAKLGVLTGSLLSALAGFIVLRKA